MHPSTIILEEGSQPSLQACLACRELQPFIIIFLGQIQIFSQWKKSYKLARNHRQHNLIIILLYTRSCEYFSHPPFLLYWSIFFHILSYTNTLLKKIHTPYTQTRAHKCPCKLQFLVIRYIHIKMCSCTSYIQFMVAPPPLQNVGHIAHQQDKCIRKKNWCQIKQLRV